MICGEPAAPQLALGSYPARTGRPADRVERELVLAFKAGAAWAVETECRRARAALAGRAAPPRRTLVLALPGHLAGGARPSTEALSAEVANCVLRCRWIPAGMVRTARIRRSRGSQHRPSTEEHLATLALALPDLGGADVILVDDVVAFGRLAAAAAALVTAAGARSVGWVFAARAVLPGTIP